MMKKRLLMLVTALLMVFSVALAVACDGESDQTKKYKVTFYDGTSVIKEVTVSEGGTVDSYTPEKDGYDFINWFSTPSKNHKFDFTSKINADTSVYAGFSMYKEDTRSFYIVGSGTSNRLLTSQWGNGAAAFDDNHKLTKTSGKNEYKITVDLMENDEFQFVINSSWHNKRGYGYLEKTKTDDGTVVFSGTGGGYGDTAAKGKNILVKKSGNYTIILKTYPADITYDTSDSSYTDANKEVYNIGTYDLIEWVRNGEPIEVVTVVTDFYIKGSGITGWLDIYNSATKMANNNGVYTATYYLKKGEQFMFSSTNTALGEVSVGTKELIYTKLDEASKALFTKSGNNFEAKADGMYTFTYTESSDVLKATLTQGQPAAADYYLDGTFGSIANNATFNSDYKMTNVSGDVYAISGIELKAGDKLYINSVKQGAENWGSEESGWNSLGSYNYPYVSDKTSFEAVSAADQTIKVKTAGTYTVLFNSYSKIVDIVTGYDIYVKGTGMKAGNIESGWDHGFKTDWKFTKAAGSGLVYEITLDFSDAAEFVIAKYNVGASSGNGTTVNGAYMGKTGDANSLFTSSGNFKTTTAGKYKVVIDAVTNEVNIFKT